MDPDPEVKYKDLDTVRIRTNMYPYERTNLPDLSIRSDPISIRILTGISIGFWKDLDPNSDRDLDPDLTMSIWSATPPVA